jgi:zinc transporter, ZIP family
VLLALVIATCTGLATSLGVIPFLFRATIPRKAYDAILGMGAGLMLSAATLGLLASALEDVRKHGVLDGLALAQVLGGFAAGVLALALMERFVPHQHAGGHHEHISHAHEGAVGDSFHPHELEHHEHVRQGLLISGAMTIHRLPEGFAIGAGFAAGVEHTLGWVLAVAIAFQNICEGAVMAAPLRLAGWSRARCFFVVSATGLAVPVAALVGHAAAANIAGALPLSLAFASGALIYLISNEVIPETHSHGNEGHATLGLVVGFCITMLVRSLGHAH